MKKITIIIFSLLTFISCSKVLQNGVEENTNYLKEIVDLNSPVDVEITSIYTHSSISNEFKSFNTTATFKNEDENAVIDINGFILQPNKKSPNIRKEVGDKFKEFHSQFKDKSGTTIPIKISNSGIIGDLNTDCYLPKTGKFDTKFNSKNKTLELFWKVDENIPNNIMLVKLKFEGGISFNLKFDSKTGYALFDLNSIKIPTEFNYFLVDFIYGTAKIVETENKLKVRLMSIVNNNTIVYYSDKVE